MSKFTSVPTTTTLSVSDSLIVVITFSVNGWMNLTSSPKMANLSFEFNIFLQTKTALPSSLVLCFICNIFIHVIYNLKGTVFRCSIQSCVLYRLLDEQLFCYVWRRPMVIRGLNIFTSIISCHHFIYSKTYWEWELRTMHDQNLLIQYTSHHITTTSRTFLYFMWKHPERVTNGINVYYPNYHILCILSCCNSVPNNLWGHVYDTI